MNDTFPPFAIARLPRIEFGSGTLEKLPAIAAGYGRHLLLVTGLRSFAESEAGARPLAQLQQRGVSWEQVRVSASRRGSSSMPPSPPCGQRASPRWSASAATKNAVLSTTHGAFWSTRCAAGKTNSLCHAWRSTASARADLPRIVAASSGSSMKTHPLVLSNRELTQVLASRL